nr:uncharacterized protein LOC106028287 [Cavia porcellus]
MPALALTLHPAPRRRQTPVAHRGSELRRARAAPLGCERYPSRRRAPASLFRSPPAQREGLGAGAAGGSGGGPSPALSRQQGRAPREPGRHRTPAPAPTSSLALPCARGNVTDFTQSTISENWKPTTGLGRDLSAEARERELAESDLAGLRDSSTQPERRQQWVCMRKTERPSDKTALNYFAKLSNPSFLSAHLAGLGNGICKQKNQKLACTI